MQRSLQALCGLGAAALLASPAAAESFTFSTGNPDGKMATASRPESMGKIEIESADDFSLSSPTVLKSATFTGLLPAGANVNNVVVEIYRVFPNDSDVNRTSGPPTFSTPQVPTRVNSPSDVALVSRDKSAGELSYTVSVLSNSFTASNSVLNGINPKPAQTTGGEGAKTGQEVQLNVTFNTPINLPADHYFFVPQVEVAGATDADNFFWLSAARPIVPPGTPFPAGVTDLQAWIRNQNLDPDWLRIGTDIVGGDPAPTFNAVFSLNGEVVPLPAALPLFASALAALGIVGRRRIPPPPKRR